MTLLDLKGSGLNVVKYADNVVMLLVRLYPKTISKLSEEGRGVNPDKFKLNEAVQFLSKNA